MGACEVEVTLDAPGDPVVVLSGPTDVDACRRTYGLVVTMTFDRRSCPLDPCTIRRSVMRGSVGGGSFVCDAESMLISIDGTRVTFYGTLREAAQDAPQRPVTHDRDVAPPALPSPVLPLLSEPWPKSGPSGHAFRPCPVCGKPWRPWSTSRLPCHAACLFDHAARHEIRSAASSGRYGTQAKLAAALGVSLAILRAVLA